MRIIAIQCNKPFFQLNRIICNNPQAIFTFSDREEEMKNGKKMKNASVVKVLITNYVNNSIHKCNVQHWHVRENIEKKKVIWASAKANKREKRKKKKHKHNSSTI